MDTLPAELFDVLLEHIWSLDDLGALCLVNQRAARLCANILPKTLWRIAHRTCHADCDNHQDEFPCGCSVVVPALQEPESVPFKVRAWLYRRASVRSFGTSEEVLRRCIVSVNEDMKNPYEYDPYDPEHGRRKLGIPFEEFCEGDDFEEREWKKVWLIFKRHLVGDGTVRPEWRKSQKERANHQDEVGLTEKKNTKEKRVWL